jgi:HemY protein
MAEIEEGEHGDQGKVRFWLNRAMGAPRDPAWVADGQVFERWAAVSPVSGRVDAFEWKIVASPRGSLPVAIDADRPRPGETAVVPAQPSAEPVLAGPAPVLSVVPDDLSEPGMTEGRADEAQPRPPGEAPIIQRAPDDPGPEPVPEQEDAPRRFRFF